MRDLTRGRLMEQFGFDFPREMFFIHYQPALKDRFCKDTEDFQAGDLQMFR